MGTIQFINQNYEVLNNYLASNNFSKIFFIVDENTNEFCLPKILPLIETNVTFEIIEIEVGETTKNIETCISVWEAMFELGADKKSLIINVGGGVITDLGGFIATTFKRGIKFINIPTTLLAMVDASVGGKNGIDFNGLKNQIGTITNPEMILIDVSYLETLPQRELYSGLAEMLKHGLIANVNHWNDLKDLSNLTFDKLAVLIEDSVAIKNKIVAEDPTEKGIRKALNFGHTLGHAIETYFLEKNPENALLHGEAIAHGMILESHLSFQKGFLSKEDYSEIKSTLFSIYKSIKFTEKDQNSIIELLIHDKKNEFGKVNFVLLNSIGKVEINQEVENEMIIKSFEDYHKY